MTPLEGIIVSNDTDEVNEVYAQIEGPAGTPYQAPRGLFLTKLFHPNVSSNGEICVNALKKDWDPANWSIGHIFQVIRCLLIEPFPESALNEQAGKMLMESYEDFARYARMFTEIHAVKPVDLNETAKELSQGDDQDQAEYTLNLGGKKSKSGSKSNSSVKVRRNEITKPPISSKDRKPSHRKREAAKKKWARRLCL
eukprot:CAMPEP_0115045764 /NCGR_PEP_ID=MMETSP0216-20121206/48347_1 /TAXON_ID=223996 /ORGANISM="Protocruzia adherens, Strain Boccale" /LENGTH=196 /DNA_ID=CAMNT_0002428715 /DNA_START=61 /DNA_END=651 /DNA_ORIENTATION=-